MSLYQYQGEYKWINEVAGSSSLLKKSRIDKREINQSFVTQNFLSTLTRIIVNRRNLSVVTPTPATFYIYIKKIHISLQTRVDHLPPAPLVSTRGSTTSYSSFFIQPPVS